MTCPHCKAIIGLRRTANLMGGYDGGGRRCREGMSCVICGHWIETVHVAMPGQNTGKTEIG